MEQTLELTLDFNEETSRILLKKYFKYVWKKAIQSIKRLIIYTIGFGFLFYLTVSGNSDSGLQYIFGVGVILMLSLLYFQTYQYFFSRKKYFKSLETYISEQKAQNITNSTILADSNSLILKDTTFEVKAIWSKVTYFYIDNEILIISFNIGNKILYLIDTKENKESISDLIHYLETYSKIEKH